MMRDLHWSRKTVENCENCENCENGENCGMRLWCRVLLYHNLYWKISTQSNTAFMEFYSHGNNYLTF